MTKCYSQELEGLQNLGNLLEKVRVLLLLGCSTPLHVHVEQVRHQREADVERQAAEEDGHHGGPLEVLKQRAQQGALARAVPDHGEGYPADEVENHQERDEDLPGGEIEVVERVVKPANEEVVDDGHGQPDAYCEV